WDASPETRRPSSPPSAWQPCARAARAVRRPGSARHCAARARRRNPRSEEHTSELQSLTNLVCRLLLEKKNHAVEVLREHGHDWVPISGGSGYDPTSGHGRAQALGGVDLILDALSRARPEPVASTQSGP